MCPFHFFCSAIIFFDYTSFMWIHTTIFLFLRAWTKRKGTNWEKSLNKATSRVSLAKMCLINGDDEQMRRKTSETIGKEK